MDRNKLLAKKCYICKQYYFGSSILCDHCKKTHEVIIEIQPYPWLTGNKPLIRKIDRWK